MKKKAIPPFVMTAGQSGRLLFDFSLPEGAARPVLRGALMVHGERVDMAAGDGELTIPALPAGVYLAEVRAGGVCVLYGHVEVLPSPLYADAGEARYEVAVDARADVLEVHVVLREGPRGMSAYEIARQEGFEGTEAEWLEYLREQNATLAVQQVTPLMERAESAATNAKACATAAQQSATEAAQSAELLGDAALQSGDNAFTGTNEFTNGIIGQIPCSAWLFSGCKSSADFKEILPYAYKGGNYLCCEVSGIRNAAVWGDVAFYNEQFEVDFLDVYYFGKDFGNAFAIKPYKNKRLRVFAPFASGELRLIAYPYQGEKVEIYAPNCTLRSGHFGGSSGVEELTILAATQTGPLTGTGCWWYYTIKKLNLPMNKYKEIVFSNWPVLEEVLPGFPHATKINFQKSKLNKASVKAILNNLLTYDAETMTAIPELTLGIDPTLDGDAEINEALLLAQTAVADGGKGWNVAVSGFTITAGGGTTMALRKPIFAKRWQAEDGRCIDAEGVRYSIRYGNTVLENWVANEQLGYEEFGSIEDALNEWGLTEVEDLTEEEE